MKAFVACVGLAVLLTACTRPLVTGRDYEMEPISQSYNAPVVAVVEAAEQTLENLDYKIEYVNADEGVLRTGWRPVTVDSHYVDVFGKQDYGANGAYYYLTVRIEPEAPSVSHVTVAAPIRSIVALIHTTHRLEKKFLAKLGDQLRPANIDVTNIGIVDPNRPVISVPPATPSAGTP